MRAAGAVEEGGEGRGTPTPASAPLPLFSHLPPPLSSLLPPPPPAAAAAAAAPAAAAVSDVPRWGVWRPAASAPRQVWGWCSHGGGGD